MLPLLLNAVTSLVLLTTVHWYLWRRLVRDVSRKGGRWRRLGTLLLCGLPATTVATLLAQSLGIPFGV
ncbi:metallophosphoesterase, partial [Streptomyces sp. TR02-1]